MVPDNIGRSTGGTNDAPQFTAFGAAKPSTTTGKGGHLLSPYISAPIECMYGGLVCDVCIIPW